MRRKLCIFFIACTTLSTNVYADDKEETGKAKSSKKSDRHAEGILRLNKRAVSNPYIFREAPAHYFEEPSVQQSTQQDTTPPPPFKPSVQVGSIVHMFGYSAQGGFGPGGNASEEWSRGFNLYRARVLVGGQLSPKGSFFFETELPAIIGTNNGARDSSGYFGAKNVSVSQVVLDCQYEHKFADAFQIIAGKQLVSSNRNGLQGAASLMANDFTYFQYPYNTFPGQTLRSNYGRDLGVNFRGLVAKDKLEYRLGFFTGANLYGKAPLRTVGRLVYNFLDADKSFYYAGTNLGKGKTVSLGAGFDTQGPYFNTGIDLFVDVPAGEVGSLTLNSAFQYMTGGTGTGPYSGYFSHPTRGIPKQTVQLAELGFYIKSIKLQPYLRFENQAVSAEAVQAGGAANVDTYNKLNANTIFGGGLNYFFNGYGTNLRLSYTTFTKNVLQGTQFDKKTFGQLWLQLQFFVF